MTRFRLVSGCTVAFEKLTLRKGPKCACRFLPESGILFGFKHSTSLSVVHGHDPPLPCYTSCHLFITPTISPLSSPTYTVARCSLYSEQSAYEPPARPHHSSATSVCTQLHHPTPKNPPPHQQPAQPSHSITSLTSPPPPSSTKNAPKSPFPPSSSVMDCSDPNRTGVH